MMADEVRRKNGASSRENSRRQCKPTTHQGGEDDRQLGNSANAGLDQNPQKEIAQAEDSRAFFGSFAARSLQSFGPAAPYKNLRGTPPRLRASFTSGGADASED